METICKNDKASPEVKQWFKYWIEEDKIYTPIDIIKTIDGQVGLVLEECPNPSIDHPSGYGTFQPSYNIKRFSTLSGGELTENMIKEIINQKVSL